MSSVPSISIIKVGNTIYDVKDLTARKHLIEIRNDQPTSEDNQIWIKEQEDEYRVPSYEEFQDLYNKYIILKARVDRLDPT